MTGNKDIMYTYERVENASVEIDKTVYDPEMGNGERKTDVDYFLKVYTGKDKQITGVMKEFFHALHNGRLIHLTIDRHDEFGYCNSIKGCPIKLVLTFRSSNHSCSKGIIDKH